MKKPVVINVIPGAGAKGAAMRELRVKVDSVSRVAPEGVERPISPSIAYFEYDTEISGVDVDRGGGVVLRLAVRNHGGRVPVAVGQEVVLEMVGGTATGIVVRADN